MTQPTQPTIETARVTWLLDPSGYIDDWTEQERTEVEAFLRAHGLDPRDVPISNGSSIQIREVDGARVLELWVFDRQDGRVVVCPTCPGCTRQKRLSIPLVVEPPPVSTAWPSADDKPSIEAEK